MQDVRVAPSILSADFARLGEQVEQVMDAGARVIHVDVMDGHFVPPITIGDLIVGALRDLVHDRGGVLDVHLMVERPERRVREFADAGADTLIVHWEATPHVHYAVQAIRAVTDLPIVASVTFTEECVTFTGRTPVEVAQALGLKLNTVYSRLRHARHDFEAAVARRTARDEWRLR